LKVKGLEEMQRTLSNANIANFQGGLLSALWVPRKQ